MHVSRVKRISLWLAAWCVAAPCFAQWSIIGQATPTTTERHPDSAVAVLNQQGNAYYYVDEEALSLWRTDASDIHESVIAPQVTLGSDGTFFSNHVDETAQFSVNDHGDIVQYAKLGRDNGESFDALVSWHTQPEVLGQAVAFTNQRVPALPGNETGGTFDGFDFRSPIINNNRDVFFYASATELSGVWLGTLEGVEELVFALGANMAVDTDAPVFADLFYDANNDRNVLIGGRTGASSLTTQLWVKHATGDFRARVTPHSQVPGGGVFRSFGDARLNSTDHITFVGELQPGVFDVPNNQRFGIWIDTGDELITVMRAGDVVEGQQLGTPRSWDVNDGLQVAHATSIIIDESPVNAVWLSDAAGQDRRIVDELQLAPGSDNLSFREFGDVKLNEVGQVAFEGRLSNQSQGVWAVDADGIVQSIVQPGDIVTLADSTERTVSFVSLFGINNHGQVGITVDFDDGSQRVLVSDRIAVPEPATVRMLLSSGLFLFCCRKRKNGLYDRRPID